MKSHTHLKVLVAPAEYNFTTNNYHVTYNLLKRINAQFTVITNEIDNKTKTELSNVNLYELHTSFTAYPFKVFMQSQKLVDKIDLIHHLSPYAIGKDFNLLGLTQSKPFIIGPVEIPHTLYEDELSMLKPSLLARLAKNNTLRQVFSIKTLRNCDIAVAVNNQTKKHLLQFISKEKIKIIPLGVDLDIFRYSSSPQPHDILAIGSHITRKGFNYLINAMPIVLREYPDATLHITSDGPQTPMYKKLVNELDLNTNIIFYGKISTTKLLDLYKYCTVFCHPSLSEGLCHTTLEAMAMCKAVVSTKTVGSEMVEHNKTGLLVKPSDSMALADAIIKLFDNPKLRYKMGVRGRKKIENEYDWNLIAKKYYDMYKEIVG